MVHAGNRRVGKQPLNARLAATQALASPCHCRAPPTSQPPPPHTPLCAHLQRRVAEHLLELDVAHGVALQQLVHDLVQHLGLLACGHMQSTEGG